MLDATKQPIHETTKGQKKIQMNEKRQHNRVQHQKYVGFEHFHAIRGGDSSTKMAADQPSHTPPMMLEPEAVCQG